jgi:hypothetical protein
MQSSNRGSASQAAAPLAAVLSEELAQASGINQLSAGLDAATMRQEEFTAAKEAARRALGAEILTVDAAGLAAVVSGALYADGKPDVTKARSAGGGTIVTTTRIAGAAERLLDRESGRILEQAAAASAPAENQTESEEDKQEEIEMYTPAVSTWGVAPRPKDISKAYGGGRNIAPGQPLETSKQKQKREAAFAAAMAAYKAKVQMTSCGPWLSVIYSH